MSTHRTEEWPLPWPKCESYTGYSTTPLPTGAFLRSGECTDPSATQPRSPDIQAQEGCSGSRSLSHSRREHWCWLEIFRNTELIYWTNFLSRSLNFNFYRVCHSSVFLVRDYSALIDFRLIFCDVSDNWTTGSYYVFKNEGDQSMRRERKDQVDFLNETWSFGT